MENSNYNFGLETLAIGVLALPWLAILESLLFQWVPWPFRNMGSKRRQSGEGPKAKASDGNGESEKGKMFEVLVTSGIAGLFFISLAYAVGACISAVATQAMRTGPAKSYSEVAIRQSWYEKNADLIGPETLVAIAGMPTYRSKDEAVSAVACVKSMSGSAIGEKGKGGKDCESKVREFVGVKGVANDLYDLQSSELSYMHPALEQMIMYRQQPIVLRGAAVNFFLLAFFSFCGVCAGWKRDRRLLAIASPVVGMLVLACLIHIGHCFSRDCEHHWQCLYRIDSACIDRGDDVFEWAMISMGVLGLLVVLLAKDSDWQYPRIAVPAIFLCLLLLFAWYQASITYVKQVARASYVLHAQQPEEKTFPASSAEKH
jgi:hypothetical protein